MEIGDFLHVSLTIIAALGSIATLLKIEKHIFPPRIRSFCSRLFESPKPLAFSTAQAIDRATEFFDWVFSPRHWSIRCLLLSTLFTVLFSAFSFALIRWLYGEASFQYITELLFFRENYTHLALALGANIIMDYFSLYETRVVLAQIKSESSLGSTLFWLLVDLVFSIFIFMLMFTMFKTSVDIFYIYQHFGNQEIITINHGPFAEITLQYTNGFINNFLHYGWSALKYSLLSALQILESGLSEYWFSSLFIGGETQYVTHVSTIWLTTHLSSIYIYIFLILWGLSRIPVLGRLPFRVPRPGQFLFKGYAIDPQEYPFTIIISNLLGYLALFFLLDAFWGWIN